MDQSTFVSVRGAGTGLSAGAVAFEAGLNISMERINHILHIDAVNRLAEVQAGVINGVLDKAVRD
ncbi:MAG: FAD-binding oxidoreductase [Yaniella sp.]